MTRFLISNYRLQDKINFIDRKEKYFARGSLRFRGKEQRLMDVYYIQYLQEISFWNMLLLDFSFLPSTYSKYWWSLYVLWYIYQFVRFLNQLLHKRFEMACCLTGWACVQLRKEKHPVYHRVLGQSAIFQGGDTILHKNKYAFFTKITQNPIKINLKMVENR